MKNELVVFTFEVRDIQADVELGNCWNLFLPTSDIHRYSQEASCEKPSTYIDKTYLFHQFFSSNAWTLPVESLSNPNIIFTTILI